MTKQDVTPDTLTDADLQGVLDRAHEWPCHVRHAASVAKFSPGATRHDRQAVCDALNANGGCPTGDR